MLPRNLKPKSETALEPRNNSWLFRVRLFLHELDCVALEGSSFTSSTVGCIKTQEQ